MSSRSRNYKQDDKWRTGFGLSTASWIQKNLEIVETLPEPSEEWCVPDVGVNNGQMRPLQEADIVEQVGTEPRAESSGRSELNVYRTTQRGYDAICEFLSDRQTDGAFTPCPCETDPDEAPHPGVSNLGGGEYTCAKESCDQIFSRDEMDL